MSTIRPANPTSKIWLRNIESTHTPNTAPAIGTDVSQSYLSAVEHGRNEVGVEVLLAISREFGKSLEWLLAGEA
jgi:hypothetical protein